MLALVLENFPALISLISAAVSASPIVRMSGGLREAADSSSCSDSFVERYDNKYVHFKCEPGRYLAAECGLLSARCMP